MAASGVEKKILGVIGGLGPMATACFMELVTDLTDAGSDQDHIETVIISRPKTPDRTAFITGKSSEDPYPYLLDSGKMLKDAGAGIIAVPCITARYFKDRLEEELGVPVIHGVDEAAARLAAKGIRKAGIMATDGSIKAGIIRGILEDHGIEAVVPDEEYQKDVMSLIYDDVKTGRKPDLSKMEAVREHLVSKGAGAVILGCTELSVISLRYGLNNDFFDILEVLAEQAVVMCGGKVRKKD